jgi:GH15 family glucan-1,4-alpha-glucosidase
MRRPAGGVADGGSPFPPIADYAFLSDCEVAALIAPSGSVEWMCVPRFDAPSVFGAMLDRDAGAFKIAPVNATVPAGRRYLPGTMVLETTWGTRTGWLIVRDALLVGPWHHDAQRSTTHRRAPTDAEADHVLLRTLHCVTGSVEVRVECEPKPDYGLSAVQWEYDADGYGSAVGRGDGAGFDLHLTTDLQLGFEAGRAVARTRMRDDETAFVALGWSEQVSPRTANEAATRLEGTSDFWHEWLSRGDFPTTRGAPTSSAARSRSRASRTRRPAR